MSDRKRMAFRRFGRTHHLSIGTADDLAKVLDLDQAHWVATSAPTATLSCDATFLRFLDNDNRGRILACEVIEAIRWLLSNLRDRTGVTEGSSSLRLDAINIADQQGERIHGSVFKMLDRLGLADSPYITLDQVRQVKAQIESMSVSEAGVVLPSAADDDEIKQFIADIVATVGGAPHPSGPAGVGQGQLDEFGKQAKAHLDWTARGQIPQGQSKSDVMPLGPRTAEAFDLYAGLRDKIDQYFAQCEAVAFEPRAAELIGPRQADLQSLDLTDPQAIAEFVKDSPLAKPRSDRVLRLADDVNPYYSANLAKLRTGVLEPALGESAATLSDVKWSKVKQLFAPYEAWTGGKAGTPVEPLGVQKLRAYLDPKFAGAVRALIAQSAKTAIALDGIRLTEKLILYQANLLALANNFVSLPYLYDPSARAMIEMGTLVMDGRHFNLAVKVHDRSRHSSVAKTSNICVLYVEVLPGGDEQKYEVAVPVTSGGKGNLCVGKRGVFIDIAGRELDARVVQIIDNPISITEALVSPFQRIARLLTGKIEAMASAAEKKLDTTTATATDQLQKGVPPAQPARAGGGLLVGGILMGGGVAVAALGSSAAYISKTLAGVETYKIVIGIAAAILAVMLPTSLIGLIRLRRRDLSAILEGSGWAINARMRLTLRQGRFFTQRPRLPKGASGVRRKRWWFALAVIVLIAAMVLGWRLRQSKPTPAHGTTTQASSAQQ